MSIKEKRKVTFLDEECSIEVSMYPSGQKCIELYDSEGMPFATATANVPGANLNPDEVIIKDYSENEGMFESLVTAGMIVPTGRSVRSGFATFPIGRLIS